MFFLVVIMFLFGQCLGQRNRTLDKKQWRETSRGGWGGWGSHENSHYQVQHYQQYSGNNQMDLYSLLGGLSFASLLGATLVYLARRNNSGRRRKRSLFDDDDDLMTPPEGVENIYFGSVDPVKLY